MKLYSTNHESPDVDLRTAVIHSLPADNGLYMPKFIPQMPEAWFREIYKQNFADIAFQVAERLIGANIHREKLEKIIRGAINFDAPIVELEHDIYSLELWHGPTLAFKDFGARFMARLMSHYLEGENTHLQILVATSGDTGGAVANGFYQVPGIQVTILYPSGKVSDLQEKQLTTLGENIRALEVKGTFDDCQHLVKQAFLDKDLNEKLRLSSANSINIARLIPQSFYYFYAYAQLHNPDRPVAISVPSGNFGNLTAGLIAKTMGLPVAKFVAAVNSNRTFCDYMETGTYVQRPSVKTISNAMDVGNPSNFTRIKALYDNDIEQIRSDIYSESFDDHITRKTIKNIYEQTGYITDPHGAVGYLGLKSYLAGLDDKMIGIFLETAHPSKFIDVVEEVIDKKVEVPERLERLSMLPKVAELIGTEFLPFKEYLLNE